MEDISYAGMQFTRFNITNAGVGVFCASGAGDTALFQSCNIQASDWAVRSLSTTALLFQNCNFQSGGIKLDTRRRPVGPQLRFRADRRQPCGIGRVGAGFTGGQPFHGRRQDPEQFCPRGVCGPSAAESRRDAGLCVRQAHNAHKPGTTNLYIVTAAPYNAVADGITDATAAFQSALSNAAAGGGGIVFAPAGNYRLNGNLTVPSGVELRGIYELPHGTKGLGSVLHVYPGRNKATARPSSSSANAGIRGLSFHYPEQIYDTNDLVNFGMVPYPFLMRGLGADVYVINVAATIPWQLLDLAT